MYHEKYLKDIKESSWFQMENLSLKSYGHLFIIIIIIIIIISLFHFG